MKIIKFNRKKDLYKFEVEEIETDFHSHPACEIIFSSKGSITIETKSSKFENIYFSIIPSNLIHRIIIDKEKAEITMVEGDPIFLGNLFADFGIPHNFEIYTESFSSDKSDLMDRINEVYKMDEVPKTKDDRVNICLEYLNSNASSYIEMINALKSKTFLSESRISHLFKKEVGISLKKYLVWSKLKKAFELVINGKVNMFEASLECGFYDQAHLSKAFRQMFGLKPSKTYNSRTIQK